MIFVFLLLPLNLVTADFAFANIRHVVGHPFDTIKVRLQTSSSSHFSGPLDCVLQTVRHEGLRALYKGATPPLVGWMFMDSLMLGSLTVYRRLMHENIITERNLHRLPAAVRPSEASIKQYSTSLPALGHGFAGIAAGWTVSTIATPIEHIKARLQVQYSQSKSGRFYSGPIDCVRKISSAHGITGLWHGFSATLIFRSFFFFWWGSYALLSSQLRSHTTLREPAVNFWAGGLSAQVFWLFCYPSDVIKQAIMTDPLGGRLGDGQRKYRRWIEAARAVGNNGGMRGYWRGFTPCFIRAFPANAAALVVFEGVLRALREGEH